MKNVLGFFIGVGVCLLIVVTIAHFSTNVSADSSSPSTTSDSDLIGLIPNVGEIYDQALGGPYRQVESEITDPDIARYYQSLMNATGLDKIGATPANGATPSLYSIALYQTLVSNLVVGSSEQYTAIGTYTDGSTEDISSQVTWTSSCPSVANISSTGLVTGTAAGTTYITATLSDKVSVPVTLNIVTTES